MPKRILIVEDEPELQRAIQLILDLDGYATLTARGGAEGLQMLDQQPVDLLILDLMMPGVDGWEVLRQLKGQGKMEILPVILLTAKDQSIDKMLGLKVFGARDYITKPFERKDLLERVAKALE